MCILFEWLWLLSLVALFGGIAGGIFIDSRFFVVALIGLIVWSYLDNSLWGARCDGPPWYGDD